MSKRMAREYHTEKVTSGTRTERIMELAIGISNGRTV